MNLVDVVFVHIQVGLLRISAGQQDLVVHESTLAIAVADKVLDAGEVFLYLRDLL